MPLRPNSLFFTLKQEFQEFPKFKNLSEIIFRLFYICLWFFILISCLWFSFEVHPVLVKWKSGALCSRTMSDQMAAQLNLWRHNIIMWFRHVMKSLQVPPVLEAEQKASNITTVRTPKISFRIFRCSNVSKNLIFEKSCDLSY